MSFSLSCGVIRGKDTRRKDSEEERIEDSHGKLFGTFFLPGKMTVGKIRRKDGRTIGALQRNTRLHKSR